MPRRSGVPKRDVLPDPVYNSKVTTKLINQIMLDGKRGTAQKITYEAFKIIEEKLNLNPQEVFIKALENVMPVRSKGAQSRRCELSGAIGNKTREKTNSWNKVAGAVCPQKRGKDNERKTCGGDYRRL